MTCWQPGRRLFTTAAIFMILTAAAHTLGTVSPMPDGPAEQRLEAAMRGYVLSMGMGMNPNMLDVQMDLSFTMSITFAALGLLNLLLASSRDATDGLLRRIGWLNAIWVGAFLALNFIYRIPPPLICATVIEIFVVAALFVPSSRQFPPRAEQR